jgi:hypothetical protein
MANTTDHDNWNASLQNNFGIRFGLVVRRVPFHCLLATVAQEKPQLQLAAEVAVVSFIGPEILLTITIVSIFPWHSFNGYKSLAPPTA